MEDLDEEEEDDGSVASGPAGVHKEGSYEIIGTLKDKTQSKPDFVKEIIEVKTLLGLYLSVFQVYNIICIIVYFKLDRVTVKLKFYCFHEY